MARLIDADAFQLEPDPWGGMNGVLILGRSGGKTMKIVQTALKRMIDNAPTVDAEPVVHAYWIKEQDEYGIDRGWKCSNCKGSVYEMTYEPYKGCPHCRAKMDGDGYEN